MRKRLMSVLTMFSLLLVAGVTVARAQVAGVIEADIPFSFHILDKQLPAGRYEIRRLDSEPNVMAITNLDEKSTVVFTTHDALEKGTPSQSKLIFNKYGGENFLSSIFEEGDNLGVAVMRSRMEKRMERSMELAEQRTVFFHRKA